MCVHADGKNVNFFFCIPFLWYDCEIKIDWIFIEMNFNEKKPGNFLKFIFNY